MSVRVKDIGATAGMQTEKKMNYSRISGTEEALTGRAGFGMPTLDHPVGGTCVAVGHPEVRTGSEPGGGGGGGEGGDLSPLSRAETVLSGPPAGVENVRGCWVLFSLQ